jgi:uncharacterized membrane protein
MIEDDQHATGLGLGRTLALSDGVFAIAMTLLAFQVQPPDLKGNQVHGLAGALGDLSSRYFVYALSFAVIGLFWLSHHRLFVYIQRVDDAFMLVNLVVLMAVAALPFPSAVLGRYGNERAAVVLYASAMAIAGGLMTALVVVAKRRRLLAPTVSAAQVHNALWRSGSTTVVFGASIPVAIVAPAVAKYTWIAVLGARLLPLARGRRPPNAAGQLEG